MEGKWVYRVDYLISMVVCYYMYNEFVVLVYKGSSSFGILVVRWT